MPRPAARRRLRTFLRVGVPMLLAALLAACGMVPPEPETREAKEVYLLYNIVLVMGLVVFVGVEGFIVYAIVRYRRRDDRLPTQMHGNNLIELVWTAIPTVIVLVLFVLSTLTLTSISTRAANPGVTIEVTGFQWQWTFHYLDGDGDAANDVSVTGSPATPPVMVVPVGEPIRLILRSADVIHSFYVPAFLVKRDVIPLGEGAPNELEFTVSDPGTYAGQCAEFCGLLHARMTFSVEGVTPAEYDAWFAAAQSGATPGPTPSPGSAVVKLSADQIAFDTHALEAPADQPFTLEFTNNETVPHNVAIYDGEKELFRGDILSTAGVISYTVEGLPPGEYTFICNIHPVPDMTGTLTVR
ncbi:MAG: cytochrome c oxidase subunit II [Chloroflexota bacterium]|nr:cytochrome c oxidase subunit II [Chloroflexota bacterium]